MPIHEYKCFKCEALFEVLQKLNDAPIKKCIKCGGEVHKLISSPAIQFKGTGWYITDYAKKSKTETPDPKKTTIPVKSEDKTAAKSPESNNPRQKE